MVEFGKIVEKAKHSSLYRYLLNWSVDRMVPFNKPHGFRVVEIGQESIRTTIPYKRRNLNHIRGLHACALATLSEFTTGFLLLSRLDASRYRLIMQKLEMEYHYQGKMNAFASFSLSENWMTENVYGPLNNQEAVVVKCQVKIHDIEGNHLSTGHIFWQIKDWRKVKTKLDKS